LSGVVKDSEIRAIGEQLGAEYILIINVSILEDIYFVSAKMINVSTGVIFKQESYKDRGDIEIIFDIAEVVGEKLAGGTSAVTDNFLINIHLFRINFLIFMYVIIHEKKKYKC